MAANQVHRTIATGTSNTSKKVVTVQSVCILHAGIKCMAERKNFLIVEITHATLIISFYFAGANQVLKGSSGWIVLQPVSELEWLALTSLLNKYVFSSHFVQPYPLIYLKPRDFYAYFSWFLWPVWSRPLSSREDSILKEYRWGLYSTLYLSL